MSLLQSLTERICYLAARSGQSRSPQRLRLEALEDRCLLTTYTITDLGTLPGGIYSFGEALNNVGDVVGSSALQGSSYHNAFLYRNGHVTNLGLEPGWVGSEAYAINDAGEIAGDVYKVNPNKHHAAFFNPDGTITDVGTLGGVSSHFFGINNAGVAVGYSETDQDLPTHAIAYSDGQMTDLGMLPGDQFSWAYAINDAGQIVGKSGNGGVNHAFIYQNGVMSQLDTLGGDSAVATAINSHGQVAGYSTPAGSSDFHAFVQRRGRHTMVDLGTLPGYNASYAYGVNSSGLVVGKSGNGPDTRAFVYQYRQMFNLNDLVVNGANWTLLSANAINDAGVIVGTGSIVFDTGDERLHAFMLTPIDEGANAVGSVNPAAPLDPVSAQTLAALSQPQDGSAFPVSPLAVPDGQIVSTPSQQGGDNLSGPTSPAEASVVPLSAASPSQVQDGYFAMLGGATSSSDLLASPI